MQCLNVFTSHPFLLKNISKDAFYQNRWDNQERHGIKNTREITQEGGEENFGGDSKGLRENQGILEWAQKTPIKRDIQKWI